eukprot:6315-Heterococcus_DN1.PRE.2
MAATGCCTTTRRKASMPRASAGGCSVGGSAHSLPPLSQLSDSLSSFSASRLQCSSSSSGIV